MIRIAIVEDDRHDREALKKCLNRYEKENQVKFTVTEFQDGEDIVTDYTASYDLIILDIEMAFLNGMKAAEKIRELDTNVIIIFITNMPQYAIQGYKVNALDYILKPISYLSIQSSITPVFSRHIAY
jgi:DNA-binding LytR/AlgR family response regulator